MPKSLINSLSRWLSQLLPLYLLIGLMCLACNGGKTKEADNARSYKPEELVRVNKYLIDKDADIIKGYLKRRNWEMATSPTGLWYTIYEKGTGAAAESGKLASIKYKVWLLDGTLCYSSDQLGIKKFRIGKGGVEKGLEEGILLMHVGDKARFIMPPHLAQGLSGDEDKIPPRSIILYEVELVQITE